MCVDSDCMYPTLTVSRYVYQFQVKNYPQSTGIWSITQIRIKVIDLELTIDPAPPPSPPTQGESSEL